MVVPLCSDCPDAAVATRGTDETNLPAITMVGVSAAGTDEADVRPSAVAAMATRGEATADVPKTGARSVSLKMEWRLI
jgi:hypothetical protein